MDGGASDAWTSDAWTSDAWTSDDARPADDVGADTPPDANTRRPPVDVCPATLRAADWTQRAYVSVPGCTLNVTYEPTGGNPGDRMRLELTGCPSTGSQFAEYLAWNAQDILDTRDGRFCRVDVSLDVLGGAGGIPGRSPEGRIGLSGTLRGAGTTSGQWPSVFDAPPSDWTRGTDSVGRAGIDVGGADLDFTRPIFMTVGIIVNGWTSTPDQVIYFDNPCFHVVFDSDGDDICDDME